MAGIHEIKEINHSELWKDKGVKTFTFGKIAGRATYNRPILYYIQSIP